MSAGQFLYCFGLDFFFEKWGTKQSLIPIYQGAYE
jgi:hypothetical protein